jgi:DNA-binding HxlR family transcriptional regulator
LARSEVSETGFKARAGVLTLLFLASSTDRHVLLAMLAEASLGIRNRDEDDWSDEIELDDEDDEPELDEDELHDFDLDQGEDELDTDDDAELDDAEIELPGVVAGPHAPMMLTSEGEAAVFVGRVLERWLASAPGEPLTLGEQGASAALATLLLGWSSTVVHAMAAGPLSVAELSGMVETLPREVLDEYVRALEANGLAESSADAEGEVRYAATDWLREAIAPLAAAARMEHRYPASDTAPVDALDVEAALLLTLPTLELPAHLSDRLSGSCRLSVEVENDGGVRLAGATVHVEAGRVSSCVPRLDEEAGAWAIASAGDWLETVIEPDAKRVRTGGDRLLARVLLDSLHRRLFGPPGSPPPG